MICFQLLDEILVLLKLLFLFDVHGRVQSCLFLFCHSVNRLWLRSRRTLHLGLWLVTLWVVVRILRIVNLLWLLILLDIALIVLLWLLRYWLRHILLLLLVWPKIEWLVTLDTVGASRWTPRGALGTFALNRLTLLDWNLIRWLTSLSLWPLLLHIYIVSIIFRFSFREILIAASAVLLLEVSFFSPAFLALFAGNFGWASWFFLFNDLSRGSLGFLTDIFWVIIVAPGTVLVVVFWVEVLAVGFGACDACSDGFGLCSWLSWGRLCRWRKLLVTSDTELFRRISFNSITLIAFPGSSNYFLRLRRYWSCGYHRHFWKVLVTLWAVIFTHVVANCVTFGAGLTCGFGGRGYLGLCLLHYVLHHWLFWIVSITRPTVRSIHISCCLTAFWALLSLHGLLGLSWSWTSTRGGRGAFHCCWLSRGLRKVCITFRAVLFTQIIANSVTLSTNSIWCLANRLDLLLWRTCSLVGVRWKVLIAFRAELFGHIVTNCVAFGTSLAWRFGYLRLSRGFRLWYRCSVCGIGLNFVKEILGVVLITAFAVCHVFIHIDLRAIWTLDPKELLILLHWFGLDRGGCHLLNGRRLVLGEVLVALSTVLLLGVTLLFATLCALPDARVLHCRSGAHRFWDHWWGWLGLIFREVLVALATILFARIRLLLPTLGAGSHSRSCLGDSNLVLHIWTFRHFVFLGVVFVAAWAEPFSFVVFNSAAIWTLYLGWLLKRLGCWLWSGLLLRSWRWRTNLRKVCEALRAILLRWIHLYVATPGLSAGSAFLLLDRRSRGRSGFLRLWCGLLLSRTTLLSWKLISQTSNTSELINFINFRARWALFSGGNRLPWRWDWRSWLLLGLFCRKVLETRITITSIDIVCLIARWANAGVWLLGSSSWRLRFRSISGLLRMSRVSR